MKMELRYRNFRVLRIENMKDFEKKIFIIINKTNNKNILYQLFYSRKIKKEEEWHKIERKFPISIKKNLQTLFQSRKKKKRKNAYKIPKLIPVQQVQPSVSTVIDTGSGANK